jgi:hypothetical protein
MKRYICLVLIFLSATVPAFAQTPCVQTDIDTITTCLDTSSLTTCLAAAPQCTENDVNMSVAADVIIANVSARCCVKTKKVLKLGCFNGALAQIKASSAKAILPAATRAKAIAGVTTLRGAVRTTGSCPS